MPTSENCSFWAACSRAKRFPSTGGGWHLQCHWRCILQPMLALMTHDSIGLVSHGDVSSRAASEKRPPASRSCMVSATKLGSIRVHCAYIVYTCSHCGYLMDLYPYYMYMYMLYMSLHSLTRWTFFQGCASPGDPSETICLLFIQ